MDMKRIYIASPYTRGDKLKLVRVQIDAFHILRDLGYYPIAPLLSHYINEVRDRTHKDWLEYDFESIGMCDSVVRIRAKDENGIEIPSTGADMEEAEAKRLGLEFLDFESVEELKEYFSPFGESGYVFREHEIAMI